MGELQDRTFSSDFVKRRSEDPVCSETCVVSNSKGISSPRVCTESSSKRTDFVVTREEGHRTGLQHSQPRILQQVFCSGKEGSRGLEIYSGSKQFEFDNKEGKIQNGINRDNSKLFRSRSVGDIHRSHRRLLSCHGPSSFQEVSKIQCGQPSVSVQSSSDGFDHFSPSFHEDQQVYKSSSTSVQCSPIPVPRRLDGGCTQQGRGSTAHSDCYRNCTETRFFDKPQEIGISSDSGYYFSGVSLPAQGGHSETMSGKMAKDAKTVTTFVGKRSSTGRSLVEHHRSNRFCREAGSSRNVTSQASTAGIERTVVSVQGSSVRSSDSVFRGQEDCAVVVDRTECDERSAYQDGVELSRASPVVCRRLSRRLGRGCGRSDLEGSLDTRGEYPSYQHVRIDGHLGDHHSLQGSSGRQECHDQYRQYDSNVLLEETGRYQVSVPQRYVSKDCSVVRREQGQVEMQAHRWQVKRDCGSAVSRRPDSVNRMVNSSQGVGKFVDDMGQAHSRSVRYEVQSQDDALCVSGTRPDGYGNRRVVNQLEQDVCLRIPPNSDSRSSVEESQRGRLCSGSDRTVLAQATVVSKSHRSVSGHSSGNSHNRKTVKTTSVSNLSQPTGKTSSSCMDSIKRSLQKKGFSRKVAKRMAEAQKLSTRELYQKKWDKFADWCDKRNKNPLQATIPLIAEFLTELHEDNKYVLSTIEGYRTAIGHVLKAEKGLDVGQDLDLRSLLANFARDIDRRRPPLPKWDLSFVLKVMTKEPFEPLKKVSMMYCTLKTVFLLTLATGSRRGEIHALTRESLKRDEDWSTISFTPDFSFVAKTELVNKGSSVLKEVEVKALGTSLGPDMQEDYTLCPVRALRIYMKRSDKFRSESQKKLLISVQEGMNKDISKNTISGWLKKAVSVCYEHSSPDTQRLYHVKAHDVRSMSASWAFFRNVSLESIMSACSWKSHNTFTSYYLKDLTRIQGDMLCLGPLVVAKQRL